MGGVHSVRKVYLQGRCRAGGVWSLVSAVLVGILGCSPRPVIIPRAQLIEEAQSRGEPVRSIDEDRDAYMRFEQEQKDRLRRVVDTRVQLAQLDPASYHLGTGDELEVGVFDVPELSGTGVIGETGAVVLPLIGAFKAGGLTIDEAREQLRQKYDSFVKTPRVSLAVRSYGSQKVAVLGAVNKPAVYPLKTRSSSILELLGEAGGFSGKAGNVLYFIPAETSGAAPNLDPTKVVAPVRDQRAIQVYLDAVTGNAGTVPLQIPLQGGDLIIVPEGGRVLVDGEVQKAGSYDLSQQSSLLTTLAAAGGITYSAAADQVELVRELHMGESVHLVLNLEDIALGRAKDVRLLNGDLIIVPSLEGRRMRQDTFEAIQRVLNLGVGGQVRIGQ